MCVSWNGTPNHKRDIESWDRRRIPFFVRIFPLWFRDGWDDRVEERERERKKWREGKRGGERGRGRERKKLLINFNENWFSGPAHAARSTRQRESGSEWLWIPYTFPMNARVFSRLPGLCSIQLNSYVLRWLPEAIFVCVCTAAVDRRARARACVCVCVRVFAAKHVVRRCQSTVKRHFSIFPSVGRILFLFSVCLLVVLFCRDITMDISSFLRIEKLYSNYW